jgi:hypothetical protein
MVHGDHNFSDCNGQDGLSYILYKYQSMYESTLVITSNHVVPPEHEIKWS